MNYTEMLGTREFYGYGVHKELASEKTAAGISYMNRILIETFHILLEGRLQKASLSIGKRCTGSVG